MLGNTECDDQNFRGDLCPYMFIGFRIIVRNRGPFLCGQRGTVDQRSWFRCPLDEPAANSCSMMCWLLERSSWLRRFIMEQCGGSKALTWSTDSVRTVDIVGGRVYSVSILEFSKNRASPYSPPILESSLLS